MEFSSSEEFDSEMDKCYEVVEPEARTRLPSQMRIKLENTALTCDDFRI